MVFHLAQLSHGTATLKFWREDYFTSDTKLLFFKPISTSALSAPGINSTVERHRQSWYKSFVHEQYYYGSKPIDD